MNVSEGGQVIARNMHPILHGNKLPMWIYDRITLRFLEVSEGAIRQYGYTREEFLSMTIQEIGPVEERCTLQHLDPAQLHGSCEWMHRRKDGSRFSVVIDSNALIYDGRLARMVVVREPDSRSTRDDALHEPLGVFGPMPLNGNHYSHNGDAQDEAYDDRREPIRPSYREWTNDQPDRHILERRTEEALDEADRTGHRVAVVCLDIDNLESVVERLGPAGADQCLEQVSLILNRRVRGMDTVMRSGPKAFTVVLAELDDDFDLYRVAEALLKNFIEPIYVQGQPFAISASIGVALYPDDGFDLPRLSHAADTAMQQARSSGGHRIAMFSLEVRERTELDAYMRETMKRGGFRLHYQPQYSPEGEIRTLEVLLRLPGKEAGFISPDLFIPIAEETGMIEQLGMWVIGEASRQVKAWQREFGRLAHVAVNVSPLQLRAHNFAENALSAIRAHGVGPASIEFEITERAVLNFDEVAEPMRKLAEAGIIFAVDDFGTGYSSLQHLHRLPISVLKIDRSFVQRMGVPQGAEAIIEAIVSMAHSLGMQVVAEGVETHAQRHAATRMGCDAIQGFLHAAAVEAAKIPRLMGWLN